MDVTSNPISREQVKRFRQERGLTHQELADLVGVSRNTIGDIERGLKTPRVGLAQRIARALGTNVETLFDAEELAPLETVS